MGNARVNATIMNTAAETWMREIENIAKGKGVKQTKKSIDIQAELERFIHDQPNHEKKKMLNYLLERFQREGDDFRRITGFGQYNELIAGILLGVFNTKEDIRNYKVYDGIPFWEEGDFVSEGVGRPGLVHHQVKGTRGTMGWRRTGDQPEFHILGLEKKHFTSQGFFNYNMRDSERARLTAEALKYYKQESPTDIRIVSPIYPNAVKGVFDIGIDTLINMAYTYTTAFGFQLGTNKDRPLIARNMPIKSAIKEWTRIKLEDEGKSMDQVEDILSLRTDYRKGRDKAEGFIEEIIWEDRITFWERYGVIQFRYSGPKLAQIAMPLIDTGIGRRGDKKPFYALLLDLYGKGDGGSSHALPQLEYYLRYNPDTKGNKEADYFYNRKYHNIRY